jgi:Fe2+ or Zn2+ uptake regulation protein
MPTILRFDGLRVVIYPNDHSPEHIHVIRADCEAVFELNCPEGPLTMRESYGFTTRQLRRLTEQLNAALLELCSALESIHESD